MSVVLARGNSRKDHMRMRPQSSVGFGEKVRKLKNSDKTMFYVPGEVKTMPAPTSKRPEEREFVVDSGASMEQKKT